MLSEFSNILQVLEYFSTKEKCVQYLEYLRWSDGIECPHCLSTKKIYRMKHTFKCSECRKQFSVIKGSIFENSPITLQKWFMAIFLLTSHKKGISSVQLSKDLGVTQKTAWFMAHRIRHVLSKGNFNQILEDVVEVDETYVGGKNKNRHASKKVPESQGRSSADKIPVFGLLQRSGRVLAMKVENVTKEELQTIINKVVKQNSTVVSDEWRSYKGLSINYNHQVVKHSEKQYVVGDAHTNTLEGFWSILKRGIIGTYHFVSSKHINHYINECSFRYNYRKMSSQDLFNYILAKSNHKRIKYSELIKDNKLIGSGLVLRGA